MTDNDELIIIDVISNPLYHFNGNNLYLADDLSFDDWEAIGKVLQFLAKNIQFALGDWLNYGERAYGEKYVQAVNETEYTYGTLRNFASIAGLIEPSRRRYNVFFGHYSAVASLDADAQDALLREAEEKDLKVWQTRASVNARKYGNGSTTERPPCPACGRAY